MPPPATEPPDWLTCLFRTRDGFTPRLLRRSRTAVWTDGQLVAKVYPRDMVAAATREQQLARLASTAVACAEPLGVDAQSANTVGWWRYVPATRAASPLEAVGWLQRLHQLPAPSRPAVLVLPLPRPVDAPAELLEALASLVPARDAAVKALGRLPCRFVHGDANPTNLPVGVDKVPVGLDFETAGAGPLVVDIACVAQVAAEMGIADRSVGGGGRLRPASGRHR